MEEATLEIIHGVRSHYELAGQAPRRHQGCRSCPNVRARGQPPKNIDRCQARLWILGDAIGAACWRTGYEVCKLTMTPPGSEKIRFELSLDELRHLTSLARLGFKKMMPNDRGIEMLRFCDEAHALQGAEVVERLKRAIPQPQRPFDHAGTRQQLIRNRWPAERKRAQATLA